MSLSAFLPDDSHEKVQPEPDPHQGRQYQSPVHAQRGEPRGSAVRLTLDFGLHPSASPAGEGQQRHGETGDRQKTMFPDIPREGAGRTAAIGGAFFATAHGAACDWQVEREHLQHGSTSMQLHQPSSSSVCVELPPLEDVPLAVSVPPPESEWVEYHQLSIAEAYATAARSYAYTYPGVGGCTCPDCVAAAHPLLSTMTLEQLNQMRSVCPNPTVCHCWIPPVEHQQVTVHPPETWDPIAA